MRSGTRASSLARALFALFVGVTLGAAAAAATPAADEPVLPRPQYRLSASIVPGKPQIEGTVEIAFTNRSQASLADVVLWLFPNRFSAPDPWMNDFYRQYVYPDKEFDAGGLQLLEVRDAGQPTTFAPLPVPDLPVGTAVRVPIAPLAPGATGHLTMRFRTEVPNRFGSFGEHDEELTLVGGWHPYLAALDPDGTWALNVPPPLADYEVTLSAAPGLEVVLNGRYIPPGAPAHHLAVPSVHYLSLLAAPRFLRDETRAGDTRIVLLRRPPGISNRISLEPSQTEILLGALRDIIELRPAGTPAPPAELVVVEAPLRLDLTANGEGDVIVSDRILELASVLRPLHQLQLAQAVYAELLRPTLSAREPPADYAWVSEGIANQLAYRYVERVAPERRSVYDWIDLLNVIAVVDRFESTPKIPFVSAFFPRAKEADPRRDQIMTFNRSMPPGHVVFTKVEEQVGEPAFTVLLDHCLATPQPFRACAAAQPDGTVLSERFDVWTGPYPAIDYRVEETDFNAPDDDAYRSTVTVRRVGSRPFPEPVTVRLRTIGGAPADVRWSDGGDVAVLSTTTDSRVYQAIIDPERKLIDDDRSNNAWPPRLQAVLDSADVEISSTEFGFAALMVGRLRYDYRKDFAVAGFYTNRAIGFTAGPRLHWGEAIDPTKYRHNLYAFYTFSTLDSSFKNESNRKVHTAGQLGGFGFRYDYNNVFWSDNPSDQRRLRLFGDWYDRGLGGDYGYADWGYIASATTPLLSHRTIGAMQIFNGFSKPYDRRVPNQGLYSLGGSRSIRGIGAEDSLARNIFVVRTEVRQDLFSELDLNLLDWLILRSLQGKFLVDAGEVSNSAGRIYDVGRWACGVGFGITAMYDFLGFFSASAYLDVATRVDEPSKAGDIQVLFGSTQEF